MSRLTYAQLCEQVEVLTQRVRNLEELTRSMQRDRAVRRVLAGQGTQVDIDASRFFLDGQTP